MTLHPATYFISTTIFKTCDYARFQVFKAVLRKIKDFRIVTPSRIANR
jgi:hypothetical protein